MSLKVGHASKRNMGEAGILDLLSRAEVGQLATADPDGRPYVIPVCFFYEGGRIYFHCALKGKKLDNLKTNPYVSFSVFDVLGMGVSAEKPCNSWTYYHSVVASGKARILEGDEKLRPLRLLAEKFARGPVAEMPADSVGRTCVVEITIDEISGKKNEKKI
ncbi:MAG TPA: pyridoxamine 5'-phosphate oxidase family protein [Methanocella sp.]|uniref:pyridoxamine 5'-phosphate oxidase family protein n=1 Tax=Methanocella sp. TaxID=2052833 RepID=UPI002CF47272|nr:pyridoxamine 5'-phosphate oxidase family protein [Methanocella sp.]HTY90008.1 pyridoxamine 5'-phosphate oxidase family protein [Methanocella sp.]